MGNAFEEVTHTEEGGAFMITVEADAETLELIKRKISHYHPNIQFAGNLQIGRLQIGIDQDTAEFVIALIKAVLESRKKEVRVSADPSGAHSAITREFMSGYFRRR